MPIVRGIYLWLCDSSYQWKNLVYQTFYSQFGRYFLHYNDCNYNSYKLYYKLAFIPILFFLKNWKEESKLQQVGGQVTRNISVFCLQRITLYFKAMANPVDFYQGIFLHLIPVRIIFTWFYRTESPKPVRIIFETWNLVRKCTHICSFTKCII